MDKSILIVEDNAKLASFLQKCLLAAGYQVRIEARGDKAVYRIIKEKPDLVLLDIMLPELDGKQVCQTVRHDYAGKILMLTALNDIDTEVSSLQLGADNFLTKPISEAKLLAHIDALFRRPCLNTDLHENISLGGLQIDLIQQNVSFFNTPIELTPSEFELLVLLAKNTDHCLDRDNIMYTLRGREYDGVDRSIDLRISYLRKKLGDDPHKPYKIKTIHGKGYTLVSTAWDHSSGK